MPHLSDTPWFEFKPHHGSVYPTTVSDAAWNALQGAYDLNHAG